MATQQQLRNQAKKAQDAAGASAHQVLLAGLGVAALVEEQGKGLVDRLVATGRGGEKLFDRLVARGRKVETKGRKRLEKGRKQVLAARTQTGKTVEDVVERARGTVDGGLGRLAQRLGIPQRQQIQALSERVGELTRKIDSLQKAAARPAKRRATKTAAAKTAATKTAAAAR